MTKYLKTFRLDDPVYKTSLEILVGSHDDLKWYLEFYGIENEFNIGAEDGRLIRVEVGDSKKSPTSNMTLIWLKDRHIPTLVHELLHHLVLTFHEKYIPMNWDNTEVMSYYMEYLTEQVLDEWNKPKNKKTSLKKS